MVDVGDIFQSTGHVLLSFTAGQSGSSGSILRARGSRCPEHAEPEYSWSLKDASSLEADDDGAK
jgi:hypothetical protein